MSIHSIPFLIQIKKKKISLSYPESAAVFFFSKGLKNNFETAVVNEPSVFEPLKFDCIHFTLYNIPENEQNLYDSNVNLRFAFWIIRYYNYTAAYL